MIIDRLRVRVVRTPVGEARTSAGFQKAQGAPAFACETPSERSAAMALPHLGGAFIALLVVTALVAGGAQYATTLEQRYARVLAPVITTHKVLGNALQQAALALPDLMILYGSSELKTGERYDPGVLFKNYPTGFNVFSVGLAGTGSISELQEIAASGPALSGKKVAVMITPSFFLRPMLPTGWYEHSFSDLNATALAYNLDLSLDIRQGAAARMLMYPSTLGRDPLLEFALKQLAGGEPLNLALYYASLPLAEIHLQILRLQDHWEILNYFQDQPALKPGIRRKPSTLNWGNLISQATDEYAAHTTSNTYGIDDLAWADIQNELKGEKNDLTDEKFRQLVQTSLEWRDLDLVLKSLKEVGAQTLLMTVPLHGHYYDYRGVTARARTTFYNLFRTEAKAYGTPVVTFEDHEYDTYFLKDTGDHPSLRGWVFYDQVLDDFYHDRMH